MPFVSSFGISILLKIFPALLPPISKDDIDFYEILGVQKGARESDIRKAYITKSLRLHPDKIAQRRVSADAAEEAAKEYHLVQEAHKCLSDKPSRQKYHATSFSPTRYRFVNQVGCLNNKEKISKNIRQASFGDKTRLVLFLGIFPALLVTQPVLIGVKVYHTSKQDGALEEAPWMALLTPLWMVCALFVVAAVT